MDTTEKSCHDLVSDGDNHEFEMTIRQSRRRETQQESFDDWHEQSARLQPHTHLTWPRSSTFNAHEPKGIWYILAKCPLVWN